VLPRCGRSFATFNYVLVCRRYCEQWQRSGLEAAAAALGDRNGGNGGNAVGGIYNTAAGTITITTSTITNTLGPAVAWRGARAGYSGNSATR